MGRVKAIDGVGFGQHRRCEGRNLEPPGASDDTGLTYKTNLKIILLDT